MNEQFVSKLKALLPEGSDSLFLNEPLSRHTTFRIGGPADCFIEVSGIEELKNILDLCQKEDVPCFCIGRGSNLLVSDEGYRGVVLHIGAGFSDVRIEGTRVEAGSGILLSALASRLVQAELTGFAFAAGIPGSLGGAVYMNAGAYGGEMKDILTKVTALKEDGTVVELFPDELKLGYRDSVFQHEDMIILSAEMQLEHGDKNQILKDMQDLMERRVSKQPLDMPSAGSVFKRPQGYFAGGLIEQAGLKGCQIGGARVSEKHAGFIVNAGGATAEDVVALIRHIQQTVETQFGVHLEPEMRILKDEHLVML